MEIVRGWMNSPLGTLELAEKGGRLISLTLIASEMGLRSSNKGKQKYASNVIDRAFCQLLEYFEGQRREFDLPLAPEGTPFQRQVWQRLQKVSFGERVSYGYLADQCGKPSAARAVGQAVGRNPWLIVVPCHRVIRGDNELGGFSAGLQTKKWLLEFEEKSQ